jgi:hypothetical protein
VCSKVASTRQGDLLWLIDLIRLRLASSNTEDRRVKRSTPLAHVREVWKWRCRFDWGWSWRDFTDFINVVHPVCEHVQAILVYGAVLGLQSGTTFETAHTCLWLKKDFSNNVEWNGYFCFYFQYGAHSPVNRFWAHCWPRVWYGCLGCPRVLNEWKRDVGGTISQASW